VIGENAADFGGRHDDHIGLCFLYEGNNLRRVFQVGLLPRRGHNFAVLALQPAHHGAAHHPAMAGDIYPFAGELEHPSYASFITVDTCMTSRSACTISRARSRTLVSWRQPSFCSALDGSPSSNSTSVGRK